MDFNGIQEDDRETLMTNNTTSGNISGSDGGYYGDGVATVKVVEYMLSSMSNELLCKFPDNSAFDFDYTQSSIWSPLVPHPSNPSSPVTELQRKLSYEDGEFSGEQILGSCVFNCFKMHHKFSKKTMMMKKRRSSFKGIDKMGSNLSNLVVDPVCSSPIRSKGWKKVLKAASKQFKKTMKKKDSGAHLKLSSYSHLSY